MLFIIICIAGAVIGVTLIKYLIKRTIERFFIAAIISFVIGSFGWNYLEKKRAPVIKTTEVPKNTHIDHK